MGEFPSTENQFKPGESGNPSGKPKGARSLSTIIKKMMEQEIDWDKVLVRNAEELKKFKQKYKNNAAWEAIVFVAFARAMEGDVKAMDWLSKSGYGSKQVHELENPIEEILGRYGLESDKNDRQTEEAKT